MKACVIEDYGDRGQVELTIGNKVAYALFDDTGWNLADEAEGFALPETERAFAGWEPIAKAALEKSRTGER